MSAQLQVDLEVAPLSKGELRELAVCEAVISAGLHTFYDVGKALLTIRDARLYRQEFRTFEDYCRERWDIRRRQAYRLMDAACVKENLCPIGHKAYCKYCYETHEKWDYQYEDNGEDVYRCEVCDHSSKPFAVNINESQARELASLDPETQRSVWQEAVATAPKGNDDRPIVTASHIRSVVAANSGNGIEGDEWNTPVEYIEAAREVMGGIDLDPATNTAAQEQIKASNFYTATDDGLTKEWAGRVWLNPPYSYPLIEKFTQYATEQFYTGRVTSAILIVNNCTDAGWFHALIDRFPVCFTRGRVQFWRPNQTSFATRQGQAIFYMGTDRKRFADVFSRFGIVVSKVGS